MQKKKQVPIIYTGGRDKHLKKYNIKVAPTILARIFKGADTFGIVGVIEYANTDKTSH